MSDLPVVFKVFQIVVPTLVVIIFCAGLCKGIQRAWRKRRERVEVAFIQEQSIIYSIPAYPSAERLHSTSHRPPPSYNELNLKPDLIPHEPPPSYSESISPPPFSSQPAQMPPPYTCSQHLEPCTRTSL